MVVEHDRGPAGEPGSGALLPDLTRGLIVCASYAIAMAYVESAVVVYLRRMMNTTTTLFPLAPLPPELFRVELARELATIVMLAAVAMLQSRRPRVAFAYFLYCFGVWDIFYYVWLKVLIGWPGSLLSWDVLFLIPLPWFGPVLSPCLVSLMFIVRAFVALRFEALGKPMRAAFPDAVFGMGGAAAMIGSYLWTLPAVARTGYPGAYPWWLFGIGAAVWTVTFARRVFTARTGAP